LKSDLEKLAAENEAKAIQKNSEINQEISKTSEKKNSVRSNHNEAIKTFESQIVQQASPHGRDKTLESIESNY
jgi:hypothetical protein